MGIVAQNYYRTAFLASEKWQTIRLEALVRDKCTCSICGLEKRNNDAHHIYYPKSIWNTKSEHLVTLCRHCHNIVHVILPSNPESLEVGLANFELLRKVLIEWMGFKGKQLRKQVTEGDSCWFCRAPNSPFRWTDFEDLGVIQKIPNQAICDRCFCMLVNSPQWTSDKPWRAIRMMFSAKKKKLLTNPENSDSVSVSGPESPETAD